MNNNRFPSERIQYMGHLCFNVALSSCDVVYSKEVVKSGYNSNGGQTLRLLFKIDLKDQFCPSHILSVTIFSVSSMVCLGEKGGLLSFICIEWAYGTGMWLPVP